MEEIIQILQPILGLVEGQAYSEQPVQSAREMRNMRLQDRLTGRQRLSKRSGLSKYNASPLKALNTKVADLLAFFQDNRQVTYTAIASGSETVTWSTTTPSKKDCLNVKTDRQGNVYALDGNVGIVKFSADEEQLWMIALPAKDENHIVRALWVDDFDVIYAGISQGGRQDLGRLWAYEQLPDNKFAQLWELQLNSYVEDCRVSGDKLYTIQNEPDRKRGWVRIYDQIDTTLPRLQQEWRVPFPVNSLAIKKDGSVIIGCEPAGDTTGNYWRDPDPKYPYFAPDSIDWSPYQLTDFKKRVWAWYVADDIDETDVASDLADNVEILRWRDRTDNGRHFFADLGAGDEGPTLAFDACLGRKGVRFSKTGTTQPLQSLRTEPNYSTTRSLADNQRTMIPCYEDSQWFVAMVIRPSATTPDTDNTIRWVWGQDRDNAASGSQDHILFINRDSGTSLPGSALAGQMSWYVGSSGATAGGAGNGGQPQDFTFTVSTTEPDVCMTAQLYDGGVGATGSTFQLNGDPLKGDNFTGAAHKSLEPSYLGMFRSFGSKQPGSGASGFLGDVLEIIVLDKKDRNSTTEGVLSRDSLENGSSAQSQTSNELTNLIGYLAHKYGAQALLPNSTASFPHPYGRTGSTPDFLAGPPNQAGTAVSSAQALANKRYGATIKYSAEGKIQWCANEMASGDGSRPGGFGYAVAVNSEGNVYSIGPNPTGTAGGVQQVRMIIDQGTTFSLASGDGAWSAAFPSNAEQDYKYPKIDVDEFDNLYIPYNETGNAASFRVYRKTGTVLHSKLLSASQSGFAVACDRRIPDYRNDLSASVKRCEHVIVATSNEGSTSNDTVHKVRLVSASQASGSPRSLSVLGVSGGDIVKITTSSITTPTGGSSALDSTAKYVQSTTLYKLGYWTDGRSLKKYDPITNEVTEYKSTSAGAIPSRCALIESWRGRIVLARSADEPHNWFLSKKDEPNNWDFFPPVPGETDAVAGNNSPAGLCPDIINSVVPYSEDILIFGCDHSIWMLVGDPAAGGRLELVSDITGMSFGRPWCKDPNGVLYFVGSRGGLFRWIPGAKPDRISLNKIERQLQELDFGTNYIRLAYNYRDEGVHIFQCPFGSGGTIVSHWFYELKTESFAQDVIGTTAETKNQPTAVVVIDGDEVGDRLLLLGCEDGRVRQWDEDSKNDDLKSDNAASLPIDAYVTLGPIQGAAEAESGLEWQFSGLTVVLGDREDGCRFELYAAEEPDGIGLVRRHGDLKPGRNPPRWDRVCGSFCWLRLRNSAADETFSLERAYVRATPAGIARARSG